VPDDITLKVVKTRLHEPDTARGVLFDGFPRTVAQAGELDKIPRVAGPAHGPRHLRPGAGPRCW